MAEVVKCPNCNAQLHAVPNMNIMKCEYCDTEVIINNGMQNFSAHSNEFSKQINNQISTENYEEKNKKWKKTLRKHLIIQAVLSAVFGILMETDATGIGVIMFIASAVYSFVLPVCFVKDKLFPQQQQKNNQFIDFIKIYPAFAGAFWSGMIIIAILVNI